MYLIINLWIASNRLIMLIPTNSTQVGNIDSQTCETVWPGQKHHCKLDKNTIW